MFSGAVRPPQPLLTITTGSDTSGAPALPSRGDTGTLGHWDSLHTVFKSRPPPGTDPLLMLLLGFFQITASWVCSAEGAFIPYRHDRSTPGLVIPEDSCFHPPRSQGSFSSSLPGALLPLQEFLAHG